MTIAIDRPRAEYGALEQALVNAYGVAWDKYGVLTPPTLALDFSAGTVLDSRITFTRGSNATVTGANGLIQYAPANLLTYSSDFTQAAWTKGATATVVANATLAPDGTTTASKLVENSNTSAHYCYQYQSAMTNPGVYTASVCAKYAGRYASLSLNNATTGGAFAIFDVSTGTVSQAITNSGSGFSGVSASITPVANGFYLLAITATKTTATGGVEVNIVLASSGTGASDPPTYTGDGTSGIYIWGAQLSPVTAVQAIPAYVATTTAAYFGARFDYDPTTLAAKGLLIEEQRTNRVVQSGNITASPWAEYYPGEGSVLAAITAPDGTVTAIGLNDTSGTGNYGYNSGLEPIAAATTYTYSIYVKAGTSSAGFSMWLICRTPLVTVSQDTIAWVNGVPVGAGWTAVDAGAGWFRIANTFTNSTSATVQYYCIPAPTAVSATGSTYFWGAQFEAGAFASSYIPTTTATATRAADSATITGVNFSSWYNATAGTVVWDGVIGSDKIEDLVSFTAATIAESFTLYKTGVPDIRQWMRTGGVSQYNISLGSITLAASTKIAAAYALNNSSGSLNGQTAVVSATGTPSAPTQLWLAAGATNIGGPASRFWIKRLTYYPTRLADATLTALTA